MKKFLIRSSHVVITTVIATRLNFVQDRIMHKNLLKDLLISQIWDTRERITTIHINPPQV